jgi:hypothetical protein
MSRFLIVPLVWVVGLMVAIPAQAVTVSEVAKALKSNPVYIAPGTQGTNSETAEDLTAQLSSGDNIVIVMLPEGTGDSEVLANQIDKATGAHNIVGLSVGSNVATHSTVMPQDIANTYIKRASSVSSTVPETLMTFIRDVHQWQRENPQAPASKPAKKKGGSSVVSSVITIFLFLLAAIAFGTTIVSKRRSSSEDVLKFQSSPSEVRDILRSIMHELVPQIHDSGLTEIIEQACKDTEEYFRRCSDPEKKADDANSYAQNLKSLRSVLVQYIDIQNNSRYYESPEDLMKQGNEAVKGFAIHVEESIKSGRRSELTSFKVDTNILSAERYR